MDITEFEKKRPYRVFDDSGYWQLVLPELMAAGLSCRLANALSTFNAACVWAGDKHWARCVVVIADILVAEAQASEKAPRDDA